MKGDITGRAYGLRLPAYRLFTLIELVRLPHQRVMFGGKNTHKCECVGCGGDVIGMFLYPEDDQEAWFTLCLSCGIGWCETPVREETK